MRLLILTLLVCGSLQSSTITVQGSIFLYDPGSFPTFDAMATAFLPPFDPTLGQLSSVTLDFEAQVLGIQHYFTPLLDLSESTLNIEQTATVSVGGLSVTSTQLGTFLVVNTICHECGVGIPMDISGQEIISNPADLAEFYMLPEVALAISASESGFTPNATFDAPFLTDEFLNDSFQISVGATYDYAPVPEPQMLWMICSFFAFGAAASVSMKRSRFYTQ
jgi:hypothetical protein